MSKWWLRENIIFSRDIGICKNLHDDGFGSEDEFLQHAGWQLMITLFLKIDFHLVLNMFGFDLFVLQALHAL